MRGGRTVTQCHHVCLLKQLVSSHLVSSHERTVRANANCERNKGIRGEERTNRIQKIVGSKDA